MRRVLTLLLGCLPLLAMAQQGPGRVPDAELRAWLGTLQLEARLDADVTGDGQLDLVYVAADANMRVVGILDGNNARTGFGARRIGEAPMVASSTSATALSIDDDGELVVEQVTGDDIITATTWRFRHEPASRRTRLVMFAAERYGAVLNRASVRVQWNLDNGEYLLEHGEQVTLDGGGEVCVYGPAERSTRMSPPLYMADAVDPVALLDTEAKRGMAFMTTRDAVAPVRLELAR